MNRFGTACQSHFLQKIQKSSYSFLFNITVDSGVMRPVFWFSKDRGEKWKNEKRHFVFLMLCSLSFAGNCKCTQTGRGGGGFVLMVPAWVCLGVERKDKCKNIQINVLYRAAQHMVHLKPIYTAFICQGSDILLKYYSPPAFKSLISHMKVWRLMWTSS